VNFYIKTWPDDPATLMTDNGQVLWSFNSLDDAVSVCREWYNLNDIKTDYADTLLDVEIYYSSSYM